jgi:NAD(P)-dependent dehydrogenase (short-subunit alcohol dehydrogenase family)
MVWKPNLNKFRTQEVVMASVLITGASKGIGRATAAEFTRRGHRVIATARDPRTLAGLPADQRLALDVTDPDTIAPAVREAGEIDVLVSNAGEIFYAAVEATPPEAFARLLDLNTIGALRVAQAVLPGMRARGHGRLLFVSSVAGRIAQRRQAAYAATKWARARAGDRVPGRHDSHRGLADRPVDDRWRRPGFRAPGLLPAGRAARCRTSSRGREATRLSRAVGSKQEPYRDCRHDGGGVLE